MKRSRIICSIITGIYILLSIALLLILIKSNMAVKSSVSAYVKVIHVAIFGMCTFSYVLMKEKLSKKLSNNPLGIKISKIYYYIYLAVICFVSRCVMVYILKDNLVELIVPNFNIGLGSYINYGLGKAINNAMYANAIVNAILAFVICILIKKIMLNITENDIVATTSSIMYLLLPQSLVYVTEYIKYSYNLLVVLMGVLLFVKIIDQVKEFNKKSSKYLIYSIMLGLIQALDIILGGTYVLWFVVLVITTTAAMYVDCVRVKIPFKNKLNLKYRKIIEKIEKLNISKLIYVSAISLTISSIAAIISKLGSNVCNYYVFDTSNSINILVHSRSYYIVLIILALVFEIIGVIFNRKLDVKMFVIKLGTVCSMFLTFFVVDGSYAASVFDTFLVLNTVTNMCNVCYNREERVKLLTDKN